MKRLFILFSFLLTAYASQAQCTDLFFSEYLEGASNNKAIEIYNPTANAVNLADYVIYRYNNGSAIASDSLFMVGMLAAGDVYVAGNPSAITAILNVSDTTHTITFFNGDDAMLLKNKISGDTLDIIGIVGIDPGTNWAVGSGATSEFTLVRDPNVQEGTMNWALSSTQWLVFPQNTTDSLGAHHMNPCGTPVPLTVGFFGSAVSVNEGVGTVTVTVTINQASSNPTSVDVVLTGGSATSGSDFTYTSPTTVTWAANDTTDKTVTLTITDDLLVEGTETIDLSLQNATNGATIGASTYTIDITDNDIATYPIGTINTVDGNGVADSTGLRCRVRGIVYGVNLRPAGLQFTVIDPTGGIGVFSGGPLGGYVVTEGDSLGIIGTINQFNGLTQMNVDSIEFISAGNPLSAAMVVTQLGENTESQLVMFECMTLVDPGQWGNGTASGFNADITNGTDTIQLRVDADVNLFSAPAPTGSFDVIGIGGQFDSSNPYSSGYQLLPRYTADIMGIAPVSANFSFVDNGQGDVDFTDLSVGGTSWSWNFGDGNTSTNQNPNHVYATSGTYTVTLTVSDGCTSGTSTQTVTITIIGVDAGFATANISLFPNPNNGSFQVAMGNLAGQAVRVTTTDATGKVVMVNEFESAPAHASFELNNRAAGLYLVRVESANGVFTGRMIVGQ